MIKVRYVDSMGSDLSVVNAARVSYNKIKDELDAKDIRLISYLAKHKHTSPFGHAFASFRVSAPIFVARQLVKHKFLRWNEVSRRYVDSEPTFYRPEKWRSRPVDSKQGSGAELEVQSDITATEQYCLDSYKNLLEEGVAPEMARMVLPQTMITEWIWSGSLDAFADMCNLRCKEDTQYETRVIAGYIDERMDSIFPYSWKALRK